MEDWFMALWRDLWNRSHRIELPTPQQRQDQPELNGDTLWHVGKAPQLESKRQASRQIDCYLQRPVFISVAAEMRAWANLE